MKKKKSSRPDWRLDLAWSVVWVTLILLAIMLRDQAGRSFVYAIF